MRCRMIVQSEKTSAGEAVGEKRSGGEKVLIIVFFERVLDELLEEDVVVVAERAPWLESTVGDDTVEGGLVERGLVEAVIRRDVLLPPR